MDDQTFTQANKIKCRIDKVERMLKRIEMGDIVEILFTDGIGCAFRKSNYLSDEEISEFKSNITELIRLRVQARLEELQKEFDNL